MHTAEQASKLWCPMVRASNGQDSTANAGNNENYRTPKYATCVANKCAMWRWGDGADGVGYCGLAPVHGVAAISRADVIRMAREAGISRIHHDAPVVCSFELFERFADLVAASEREACAKTCEALEVHDAGHPGTAFKIQGMCIDAIRARQTA